MYLWGNDVTTSWGGVPNETFWMKFTCRRNFNVSSFLMDGDIKIFKLVILITLSSLVILLTWSSSQLIFFFLTLSKSQLTHVYYVEQAMGVLLVWGRHYAPKNKPKPLCLTTNLRTTHISFTSHFQWINQLNQKLTSPVNKKTLKVQSFILSVTCFLICVIRINTKKFE